MWLLYMIAKQKENLILDQDSLKPRAFLFVPLWAKGCGWGLARENLNFHCCTLEKQVLNNTNLYEHNIILLIRRSGGLNINNYFLVPQTKD